MTLFPRRPRGEGKDATANLKGQALTHGAGPQVRIVPAFIDSLLVIAPHPDDETIAAGGLIKAMRDLGKPVRVVIVSDGAASHPGSRSHPPARLAALRRTESLDALGTLGVPATAVHFCDFADGDAARWHHDPVANSRFQASVHGRWGAVCLPSDADGHPDHAASRALALAHIPRPALRLAYTVWPREGAVPRADAAFRLDPALSSAKRRALRQYRSQLGAITDTPDGFTIDAELFDRFTRPVETFALD